MENKSCSYEKYGNFIVNKGESLGSGSFGHVWKGYVIGPNKSLESVAIKQSHYQSQNIKEIQTLQILKHPNIIRYIDYIVSGSSIFMVMELCESGTLEDLLFNMEEHDTEKIISYYSQIVKGIKFMYDKKILHRDLKPSNLLVKKDKIKIADFGTSKMNKSSQLKTLVGTPLFFSPELFQMKEGKEDSYTQKSQIWCLGLILYLMFNYDRESHQSNERLRASLPWTGRNQAQIYRKTKKQPLQFKKPEQIPQQVKQILQKMLKINANERMSFEQFFSIKLFEMNDKESEDIEEKSQERTLNMINKETIGWQLLELLELKENQNSAQQQVEECRKFYQLIIEQLQQTYDIQYYELMFELQLQYYQLSKNSEERQRIIDKYYERKSEFHKFKAPHDLDQSEEPPLKNQSGIIIAYEPKIQMILPLPSPKLIAEIKYFIKTNLPKIAKKQISEEQKFIILCIYDFFTLLTFQKSWQLKRRSNLSMDNYKKTRRSVDVDKILSRIQRAAQVISLN